MRKQELHPRTAVINKSQKNQSKKARTDALHWLAITFPQAFDNTSRIRPLKIGIMNDLMNYADKALEENISKSKLRQAVVLFTRRIDYLTCLKAREMRIDLQGNEVSEVTDEEAENAAAKIKKRVEKSVKNARKTEAEKSLTKPHSNHTGYKFPSREVSSQSSSEDFLPVYPLRAHVPSMQKEHSQTTKAPAIIVKNKSSRQFDPDAVKRLKERLGLSRKLEENKEKTE